MTLAGLTRLRKTPQANGSAPLRTLVVNGNPDPRPERFCAAVCAAFAQGVHEAGGKTRRLDVGRMGLPPDPAAWKSAAPSLAAELAHALEKFSWAERLFIVFPMWLARPPAQLTLLFEEIARQREPEIRLRDTLGLTEEEKHADVVVTASFPSLIYRAHAGTSGGGWTVSFPGLRLADTTILGSIEAIAQEERVRWLDWTRCRGAAAPAARITS
jgi:putative NADPH-quinone reductase